MKIIKTKETIHREQNSVCLIFKKDYELIEVVKTLPNRRWSKTMNCWYIPFEENYLEKLNKRFQGKIKFILEDSLKELSDRLKLKGYSENSIISYKKYFNDFIIYHDNIDLKDITDEQISEYISNLADVGKVSVSCQNQVINAIKFYYREVLERKIDKIQRPKRKNRLPVVLSEKEFIEILKQIKNLKHKCIICLIYSSGLRLSEVVNLKLKDIDSKNKLITVRNSEGNESRKTILSDKLLDLLRMYYKEYKPKEWLFEGEAGGKYSKRSVQMILEATLIKTNINKKVTVQTLRGSFATHLIKRGVELRCVQELLGHSRIDTTAKYKRIIESKTEKITSPVDNLDIKD